jgi:hypothetical protein
MINALSVFLVRHRLVLPVCLFAIIQFLTVQVAVGQPGKLSQVTLTRLADAAVITPDIHPSIGCRIHSVGITSTLPIIRACTFASLSPMQ